jgi:hypothetical protein
MIKRLLLILALGASFVACGPSSSSAGTSAAPAVSAAPASEAPSEAAPSASAS